MESTLDRVVVDVEWMDLMLKAEVMKTCENPFLDDQKGIHQNLEKRTGNLQIQAETEKRNVCLEKNDLFH